MPTAPPGANLHSLALNGSTGAAAVPASADLNLTGDWTIEAWFREESPTGFNHEFVGLIYKGDRDLDAEAPYFLEVGYKRLQAGLRTGWTDYAVQFDISQDVDPKAWHHAAATYQASTRTLTLYLDGVRVAQRTNARVSRGNSSPLEFGRVGAKSGKYLRGKLDDVRIWNVVRSGAEIAAGYRNQLNSTPPAAPPHGLVGNWKFDEASGLTAADSVSNHSAGLKGGATFSSDVHP